jgi:DnaJ-domain-containing protein 1
MNCEEKFDIDIKSLASLYKNLQSRLHPDKFGQCSKVSIFTNSLCCY